MSKRRGPYKLWEVDDCGSMPAQTAHSRKKMAVALDLDAEESDAYYAYGRYPAPATDSVIQSDEVNVEPQPVKVHCCSVLPPRTGAPRRVGKNRKIKGF